MVVQGGCTPCAAGSDDVGRDAAQLTTDRLVYCPPALQLTLSTRLSQPHIAFAKALVWLIQENNISGVFRIPC